MHLSAWLDLLLIVLVVSAAAIDLAIRKIPNLLLLLTWCAALGLRLSGNAPIDDVTTALGGAAVGFAVFLPLYVLRGMAAGDVKLMATVGLFFGPAETFYACLVTWCVGGAMALGILLFTRRWSETYTNIRNLLMMFLYRIKPAPLGTPQARTSVGSMPYGVAIAITTLWLLAQRYP